MSEVMQWASRHPILTFFIICAILGTIEECFRRSRKE